MRERERASVSYERTNAALFSLNRVRGQYLQRHLFMYCIYLGLPRVNPKSWSWFSLCPSYISYCNIILYVQFETQYNTVKLHEHDACKSIIFITYTISHKLYNENYENSICNLPTRHSYDNMCSLDHAK